MDTNRNDTSTPDVRNVKRKQFFIRWITKMLLILFDTSKTYGSTADELQWLYRSDLPETVSLLENHERILLNWFTFLTYGSSLLRVNDKYFWRNCVGSMEKVFFWRILWFFWSFCRRSARPLVTRTTNYARFTFWLSRKDLDTKTHLAISAPELADLALSKKDFVDVNGRKNRILSSLDPRTIDKK